jgi:hypothetical protein
MGFVYKVLWLPPGAVKGSDGEECYGITDHDTQAISIDSGMSHDRERETVVHESLHQMFGTANLGLDYDLEEKIVSFMGAALVGHMRDNPAFWRYVMQPLPKESESK